MLGDDIFDIPASWNSNEDCHTKEVGMNYPHALHRGSSSSDDLFEMNFARTGSYKKFVGI